MTKFKQVLLAINVACIYLLQTIGECFQVAAEQEEARIRQAQAEKEAKLKKFREDVKNRVRLMEKARKQKELEKSYNAVSTVVFSKLQDVHNLCKIINHGGKA